MFTEDVRGLGCVPTKPYIERGLCRSWAVVAVYWPMWKHTIKKNDTARRGQRVR